MTTNHFSCIFTLKTQEELRVLRLFYADSDVDFVLKIAELALTVLLQPCSSEDQCLFLLLSLIVFFFFSVSPSIPHIACCSGRCHEQINHFFFFMCVTFHFVNSCVVHIICLCFVLLSTSISPIFSSIMVRLYF